MSRVGRARQTFAKLVITVLLVPALALPAQGTHTVKQLAPGVVFSQDICADPSNALVVNAIFVDPSAEGIQINAAIGQDVICSEDWRNGRETVSSITSRKGALVGVNADFFPFTGDPLGICIIDGRLISEPARNRAALGILKNKSFFFDNPRFDAAITVPSGALRRIDGINRARETNQIVAYTEDYGATTRNKFKAVDVVCTSPDLPVQVGKTLTLTVSEVRRDAVDTLIPKGGLVLSAGGPAGYFLKENIKPGDTLKARFDVRSASCYDWSQVEQAAGGGPWLVRNGKPFIDAEAEGWPPAFVSTRHPRAALGITQDGKLIIVTVDGRQAISSGINLSELAALMIRLGAADAINLDGGGSTTLCVRGMVVNSPSDSQERPVANAILIHASPERLEELPKLTITGVTPEVISGQGAQLSLVFGDEQKPLSNEQLANVVWGTTNGIGFVNQAGYFTPVKAGKGRVMAAYGSQTVAIDVSVLAGPAAKLQVALEPRKDDPCRSVVRVIALDANGNRLAGKEVLLNIMGGKPDVDSGFTDEKGEFETSITWDPNATVRKAVAVVGNITGQAISK